MNIDTCIVGYGGIGQELAHQVKKYGWNIRYIMKSDGVYIIHQDGTLSLLRKWSWSLEMDFAELDFRGVSIAFIATPPSAGGKLAYEYACLFARWNIKIVVCDKSLIAHYHMYMDSNGGTATVGGGSHILPFLKGHIRGRTDVLVHLVLNATLNFIMSSEKNMDEAVAEAITAHMAEPKAGGCLVTFNNEITDTILKTCIVANYCFPPERMTTNMTALKPSDINVNYIDENDLALLKIEKQHRRYIVSFSADEIREDDTIGGFRFRTVNGWNISAGFKRLDSNPQFARLAVPGIHNVALVCKGKDDQYPCYLVGPGAGPEPTAQAMMQDAKRLLAID
jgi:homoserine dehydrogenase